MKPKLVRADAIPMLMPDFTERFGDDNDKKLATELLHVSRETRILLGQLFLFVAMTRSKSFADACNKSRASEGSSIVVATLVRSIVVATAALFGEDKRVMSLPKALKSALSPDRSAFLRRLHTFHCHEGQFELSNRRLVKYRRSIARGKLKEAINALTHVRNTIIAHFDFDPQQAEGRTAIVHDLNHAVYAASVIVGEANFYVLNRRVDVIALRKLLRDDANGFVETLQKGF
jgi:hypothetical protein